jgi:hypothetical protein
MMPTASNPKHNDWYGELCALAAIGELSSSEFEELQRHLAECSDCRGLYADFRRISADDIGGVAVLKQSEHAPDVAGDSMDERELLNRLLDRAERQRLAGTLPVVAKSIEKAKAPHGIDALGIVRWLRRPALSFGVVGLMLCAVIGFAAYRLREAQLSPALADLRAQARDWESRAKAAAAEKESTSQLLQQSQSQGEFLLRSLAEAQEKHKELANEQKRLESELALAHHQLDQSTKELAAAANGAAEKNMQIAELQNRLENAVQRTEQQRRIAEALQSKLESADDVSKKMAEERRGFTDTEAKNLFGARDLHIVDVYDVDTIGNTRRTYGRVYYAEKKLLIFYAFDLQDKHRNHSPSAFQAWGYRQPNESKPESLGLFSVDDAAVNRWVLKVNNPRVLEHIDAVFVTAEAPSGSPFPRGHKLLYANLAGPANHP